MVYDEIQIGQWSDGSYRSSYVEKGIEFSWSIESGANCDENQVGQRRDWSYKYDLRQKWNWDVVINHTR